MGTSQHTIHCSSSIPTSSSDHSISITPMKATTTQVTEEEILLELSSKIQPCEDDRIEIQRLVMKTQRSSPMEKTRDSSETTLPEVTGREKLKRHRVEVAGQVWIPDIWGQENLLKDWIDCSTFDSSLVPSGIMSARAALVQEGARRNSSSCVKS